MTLMEPSRPSVDVVYDQVKQHMDTLDDELLVEELRALLGTRLVAYLAGASNTATVADYLAGAVPVPDHARIRFETAYTVAALQHRLGASPPLIQSWFQGRNPRLNDHAPARVIAEDFVRDRRVLISAAVMLVSA